jgi:hypothetical protein
LCTFQLTLSGQNKVVIMEAHFGLSDKYRCEVSVEAPSFDTALVMAPVYVVGKSHTYITTALLLFHPLGVLFSGGCGETAPS